MCYKCKLHVDIRDEHHLFDILVLCPYLGQNGSHPYGHVFHSCITCFTGLTSSGCSSHSVHVVLGFVGNIVVDN